MRGVRTLLTGFLLVAAFLLSFGALRHRALEGGIIHGDLGVPLGLLDWRLSAHTLAGVWALALDGLTAVGVLGVRDKQTRDWRAWVALVGGLGLSLLFQVVGYDTLAAGAMAAVPPLALAMAVWIFEVPSKTLDLVPARPKPATELRPPLPARARVWLGSWDQAGPLVGQPNERIISSPAQADVARPGPGPTEVAPSGSTHNESRPNVVPTRAARPSGLTLAQRRRVEGWVAEGRRNKSEMARELGLTDRGRKHLGRLVDDLLAAQNGDRPKVDV